MKSVKYSYLLIFFLALCLAVPLEIIAYKSTGIVLADFVVLVGFIYFLMSINSIPAILLLSSIIFGLIAIFINLLIYNNGDTMRQLGSLIFFIKPCFAYFAGKSVIANIYSLNLFFLWFKKIFTIVIILMLLSIIFTYGWQFRMEGSLQVDFLGLPVAGTNGTNSLASFLAICGFILLYPQGDLTKLTLNNLFKLTFLVSFILVIFSLSRASIFFMIFSFICLQIYTGKIIKVTFFAAIILISFSSILFESLIFEAKINQVKFGIENFDLDHISSGRISLFQAAYEGIIKTPLTGMSFLGFDGTEPSLTEYLEVGGLSPHNSFITPIWKGGLLFGASYLYFVLYIIKSSLKCPNEKKRVWFFSFLLGFLLILCNIWDVLIVPIIGPLFFFLCGALTNHRRASQ